MAFTGFLLFFIGSIFIIAYPINRKKNARCTKQTEGMLRGILPRYDSRGSLKDAHVYSYCVNGDEYLLKTLEHSPQVSTIGDSCTIWYNPAKPEDAQAYRGSEKYLKTLLIIGIVTILIGILLIGFGLVR